MKILKKIDGSCAPLALKYLCGLTSEEVLESCLLYDFDQDTGMEEFEYLGAAKDLGIKLRRIRLKKLGLYRCKVGKFIKKNPIGRFLIYTNAHLFVIHDSKVVDLNNPGYSGLDRIITGAWRVL